MELLFLVKESEKVKVKSLSVSDSCDPMDCSLPGSSVHGIFRARVLEWVAISFSRGSFQPRDRTQVSCIAGRRVTLRATREDITEGIIKFTIRDVNISSVIDRTI